MVAPLGKLASALPAALSQLLIFIYYIMVGNRKRKNIVDVRLINLRCALCWYGLWDRGTGGKMWGKGTQTNFEKLARDTLGTEANPLFCPCNCNILTHLVFMQHNEGTRTPIILGLYLLFRYINI